MKKWDYLSNAVLLLAIGFLGYSIGLDHKKSDSGKVKPSLLKFNEALEIINEKYVDTVNISQLTESAVIKMIDGLDPHSQYIPPTDVEHYNEDLESSFGGIGIQFNMLTDTIFVIRVIPGGPSEQAGLQAFDRIITVDDSIVAGMSIPQNKIVRMLRGPKDSKVKVGIQRGQSTELLYYELVRGDIPNYTVDVAVRMSEHAGLIKIKSFAQDTYGEVLRSIAKLREEGATGFVIDLRGNPGGYLETAVQITNEFLPKGATLVYTEGKTFKRQTSLANGKGSCQETPLVVLIDEESGSASEIFSGAMQDNDRATLIGRRSYGKGLVQAMFPLSDNSEIKLTVARYYTPSGRCIQKDYKLGNADEYYADLYKRYMHGEYYSLDSIHIADSLEYKTVGGRTVYGGGGIMPDIFVPRDTTNETSYYYSVRNAYIPTMYALKYSDENQAKLRSFKDVKSLNEYLKNQPVLDGLPDYAELKGVPKRPTLYNVSKALLERDVRSIIIRNFFDEEGFYPVFYKDDAMINKAIELIENGTWRPKI